MQLKNNVLIIAVRITPESNGGKLILSRNKNDSSQYDGFKCFRKTLIF